MYKAKALTPESLFIVFKRDTFERMTYDGVHWKLNFPLAYELYKKDYKKMYMYMVTHDIEGKQVLIEMTELEIEDYNKTLQSKIESILGTKIY